MNEFRFICRHEIQPKIDIESEAQFFAFALGHGLLEQLTIKIETDGHDVAALRRAKNTARPADLQVAHRDPKTRA